MFNRKTHIVGLLVLVALALPIYAAAADQSLKASETGTFRVIGQCDSGGIVIEVTGTGHATVLGSYSARYQECFQPATGTVTAGSFTLTAANGDKIFGTYAGQASPVDEPYVVAFDDPGVIHGGTGRFEGASGTVTQSGQANLATGEYDAILTGTVSSPASA